MKACGIIAEYHPFHNGHAYQLHEAKKRSSADVMVVAMSGNYVQRGEIAIEEKYSRAKQALKQGADIVLEVPTLGCVQATDYFARAGMGVLKSAHCTSLSYGVEAENSHAVEEALTQWQAIEKQIVSYLQEHKGLTYARAITEVTRSTFGEESALYQLLQQPNHQLGFAYRKIIPPEWEVFPIERKGAGHLEESLDVQQFSSGTALRKQLLRLSRQEQVFEELPYLLQESEAAYTNSWENYWPLLQYIVERSSVEALRQLYQVEEGIEFRMKKMIRSVENFSQWIQALKSKRWTWARLQRMSVYVLLGITKEEMQQYFAQEIDHPTQVCVLGFTTAGQRYLRTIQNDLTQFVTKMNARQQQFDRIYDCHNPSGRRSYLTIKPVIQE